MEKTVLLLVVVAVVLTGCVGSSASPEEVRDGFVGNGNDVSSYGYEGEVTFESSPVRGTGTRVRTTTTESVLDYENRELRAEIVSSAGTPGNITKIRETTSYIVNNTGYDRTVPGSGGWVKTDSSLSVNRTWEARDELGFYARFLKNASVSTVGQRQEATDGTEARALRVELDDDERVAFLKGKLSDDPGFLGNMRMEEFNTTVWISEEDGRLVRAETEATAISPNVRVRNVGVMDIRTELSFVDEFSYDEPAEIELPQEAHNTPSG